MATTNRADTIPNDIPAHNSGSMIVKFTSSLNEYQLELGMTKKCLSGPHSHSRSINIRSHSSSFSLPVYLFSLPRLPVMHGNQYLRVRYFFHYVKPSLHFHSFNQFQFFISLLVYTIVNEDDCNFRRREGA